MKRNKVLPILISLVGIGAMLTLGLQTPTLIQEFSSTEENSNVNVGERNSSNITKFEQTTRIQGTNSVQYGFEYNESDVWYWDQKVSDYVKPTWNQTSWESYHYGSYHSSTSSKTDLPSFKITYNKPRPTHEEWREGSDGMLGEEHGGPSWSGKIPEDNTDPMWDEYQDWKNAGDDDYKVTIDDSYPYPPSFGGWTRNESVSSDRKEYTYTWGRSTQKMDSFPKVSKDWTVSNKDSGNWNQRTENLWDWSSTHGYWKTPTRQATGLGNEKVWIDWNVTSQGNTEQEGTSGINLHDDYLSSSINDNNSITFSATDSQQHSSKAPDVVIPEPHDSANAGVSGNTTIDISGLALGWEYTFEADLMYKDNNGATRQYGQYVDNFQLEKSAPTLNVNLNSVDENSVFATYSIDDKYGSRINDVTWDLETTSGSVLYTGTSKSNYGSFSFDGLDSSETYLFKVSFDYSTYTGDDGSMDIDTVVKTSNSISPYGRHYENEGQLTSTWISNVQEDSFVLNTYIDTNNNIVNDDWEITFSSGSESKVINNLKPGTNAFFVDRSKYTLGNDIYVATSGSDFTNTGVDSVVIPKTNMNTSFDIYGINSTVTNREAEIKYIVTDKENDIETFQYNINNSKWIDLDESFYTSGTHYLQLDNLNPETTYTVKFRGYEPVDQYYIYSSDFIFKTDRDTSIGGFDLSSTETTITYSFYLDKIEWLDDKNIYWEIKDVDQKKTIQNGSLELKSNGKKTFTITDLRPGAEYEVTLNMYHDGITEALWDKISTLDTSGIDKVNNARITNVKQGKHGKFTIDFEGAYKYASFYDESKGSFVKLDDNYSMGSTSVEVNPNVSQDKYTFILNDSVGTAYTWYPGIDSTLSHPKDPMQFNMFWFIISMSVIFIIIVIAIITVWAFYWVKRRNARKVNIWEVNSK